MGEQVLGPSSRELARSLADLNLLFLVAERGEERRREERRGEENKIKSNNKRRKINNWRERGRWGDGELGSWWEGVSRVGSELMTDGAAANQSSGANERARSLAL